MTRKYVRSGKRTLKGGLSKKQRSETSKIAAKTINRIGEKSHKISELSVRSVDTVAEFIALTTLTVGNNNGERKGNSVRPYSLEFKYSVATADQSNIVRMVLVQWKGDTVADPIGATQLFHSATTTDHALDTFSLNGKPQYKILYDKLVSVSLSGPGVISGRKMLYSKDMLSEIKFNTAASSGVNKIYLVLVSDSGAATHPQFTGMVHFKYTDY